MNRIIKFRVWDKKTNSFSSNFMEKFLPCWCFNLYEEDNGIFFKEYRTSVVIQQFTGLTDKNNKEIFEGDIINAKGYGSGKIIYEDGRFQVEMKNPFPVSKYSLHYFGEHRKLAEIIGNIFENPELL